MKSTLGPLLAAFSLVAGLGFAPESRACDLPFGGKIVVANRGEGTISVLCAVAPHLLNTVELPAGPNPPEPMYVWYSPFPRRVFVGDRANDQVVMFDPDTFEVLGTVPTGAGIFHMWGSLLAGQLWVNNDIDNTSTVINLFTLEEIAVVPTPQDLVDLGGKPHDVIVDVYGRWAYVTVVGVEGDRDYVVQFDTQTFEEVGRAAVGDDAHVSLTWRDNRLYVPCQGSGSVFVLNRENMEFVEEIPIPGAHGAGMAASGRTFYTTNLPGGGENALWAIDTRTLEIVVDGVNAPHTVPHNIALTPNSRRLFLTHSGENNVVTYYRITPGQPAPALLGEVVTGANPFGIAYVPSGRPGFAAPEQTETSEPAP